MAASMDSDEEDTFVVVGTPLELIDEDEVPKKAPALQDQTVRDKRGRQRFHGAFTGGFSAGFFNTVGSKEGFVPSTFVSSRSQKPETSDGKVGQKPEDFMDDEDLGEHGIAPQKITASDDFASLSTLRKRKAPRAERSAIPDLNLEDLVLPSKVPIGMRLLKKMGWREGQGVGPRVNKKKKSKPAAQTGTKVYGCAFRPPEDEDSSSDDNVPQDVTFAPKDISPFNFDPKNNLHGIGYHGLDPKAALYGHVNLFEPPAAVSKSGKKGITGHAFGVGALNEDDDDVYGVQSMIGYDREMTDESDSTYGWTAPKHKQGYSNQLALKGPEIIGKMLAGFTLTSKPLKPKKTYPAPPLPRNFRPIHVFKKPVDIVGLPIPSPPEIAKKYGADSDVKMDANTRGAIIGEKSLIGSIFDLVSKEDKEKMKAAKDGTFIQPHDASSTQASTSQPKTAHTPASCSQPDIAPTTSSSKSSIPHQPESSRSDHEGSSKGREPSRSSWKEVISPSTSGHAGFKPFASNPEKQARYEQYLEAQKHGVKYVSEDVQQTEWEREHEREEFAKAAKLYKPLSMMMANRFTRGKFDDNDETVEVPADEKGAKSDQAKAVEMKMYGKMTRDVIEWHPDKLLCRRFNVANPYPDSSQVGSLKVKRDKFSVFNFLNAPKPKEQRQRSPPRAIEFKEDPPPTSEDQQTSTRPAVSFVIGMAKKKDSVEITKEEALGTARPADGDDGAKDMELDVEKVETSADKRPPMDLFKAIFDASESSSSSSSEEEEEKIDSKQEPKRDQADNKTAQGLQMEGGKLHRFLLPSQREKKSRWDPTPEAGDSTMDTNVSSAVDCGDLSENIEQMSSASETLPAISKTVLSPPETVSSSKLEDRLGFSEGMEKSDNDEGVYGPQPLFSPKVSAPEESAEKVKADKDKHKKKKHKHKDKHKKKKKKDKKEKKSKHKKKKHKERSKHKHKKKTEASSSSGSEADSETSGDSSDEGEPSTRDLLSKIRNLPGKRLSAADFM